jgi:hypothetical protein
MLWYSLQKLFYMKIVLERYNFIIILRKKQITANFKIAIFAFFSIVPHNSSSIYSKSTFWRYFLEQILGQRCKKYSNKSTVVKWENESFKKIQFKPFFTKNMDSVQQAYISSALFILFVISLWLAVCTVTRHIQQAEPVLHYRAFFEVRWN